MIKLKQKGVYKMEILNKNSKYIGLGGCILTIIGCFLPWSNFLGESYSQINGDGKIVLILAIVTAILIYLKKDKISLVTSGIAILVFIIDGSKVFSSNFNAGIGLFTILIGLICMILYPFINKNN